MPGPDAPGVCWVQGQHSGTVTGKEKSVIVVDITVADPRVRNTTVSRHMQPDLPEHERCRCDDFTVPLE